MAVNEQVIIELVARTEAAEKQIAALTEQLSKAKTEAKKVSEDGIERVVKNGGAMAILNDLTGGLAMQFKDAYESIQLTNTGLKGMRAALIATGIGAAVVAIGYLATNWEKVVALAKVNTEEIDKQIAKTQELLTTANHQLAVFNAQEAALKNQGVTDSEILEKRKALLQVSINNTKSLIAENQEKLKALQIAQAEAGVWAALAKFVVGGSVGDATKNLVTGILGTEEEIQEAKKNLDDLELSLANLESSLATVTTAQTNIAKAAQAAAEQQKKYAEELAEDEDPQVGFTAEQEMELANFKAVRDKKLKIEEEFNAQMDAIQQKQMEDDARRNEAMEQGRKMMDDLRVQSVFATLSTIQGLSEAFAGESEKSQRKAFAVNKAASIATATAQTYLSAVAAYNSQLVPLDPTSPVRASIAAGIAIASGLVNVAKISATKFGGGPMAGGGSASPNIPGSNAPTPTNPQAALDFSFLSQQQPMQTYVIAGDVTNAQEANQKLKDQSAL